MAKSKPKLRIEKREKKNRRWAVIDSDTGMEKEFSSVSEARKYMRKLLFWHKEVNYTITKRNIPWLRPNN